MLLTPSVDLHTLKRIAKYRAAGACTNLFINISIIRPKNDTNNIFIPFQANEIMKCRLLLRSGGPLFTAQSLINHRVKTGNDLCNPILKPFATFHTSPRPAQDHGQEPHPSSPSPEERRKSGGPRFTQLGAICTLNTSNPQHTY